MILGLVLLAVIARAATRPLGCRWARLYLWCEFAGTGLLYGLLFSGISPKSELYAGVWFLTQFVVFFSAAIYAGVCLSKAPSPWFTGFVAIALPVALSTLVWLVLRSGHANLPYWVWFAVFRGQLQGTLGLVTASTPGPTSRTLGLLWLTQCCYQYAFAGGILFHRVQWAALNSWVPELMAIAGFGWLGIYRETPTPARN